MTVELISVFALFVGGGALMRVAGLRGWALLPLGYLAGVCLLITVGFVQVVTLLPTSPIVTLAVTTGLPVGWWIVRWRQGHDVRVSVPLVAVSLAAVAASVVILRAANLVKWHTDSLFYLMPGWLLANGTYRGDVSDDILTKRLLGAPLLHAPANLGGTELYLRSVTPLLAVATLAALLWFFLRGGRGQVAASRLALFGGLGALFLLTNNRFVFNAFYLNGHLLFAAQLLLIVASGWLLAGADDRARTLMVLQVIAIPALVVTRPEGFLAAALALLPTWLSASIPARHRAATMVALGASSIAWHAFVGGVLIAQGAGMSSQVLGGVLFGVVVLALIFLLRWPIRPRRATLTLWWTEGALWLALAGFTIQRPDVLYVSVRAIYKNVALGYGRYGYSLIVLGLLVLVGIVLYRFRDQAFLRFPLTTFAPLALLLAYLREGPYRVGVADSLSRMFMQYVPLALLYVLVALAIGTRARPAPAEPPPAATPTEPLTASIA